MADNREQRIILVLAIRMPEVEIAVVYVKEEKNRMCNQGRWEGMIGEEYVPIIGCSPHQDRGHLCSWHKSRYSQFLLSSKNSRVENKTKKTINSRHEKLTNKDKPRLKKLPYMTKKKTKKRDERYKTK